VKDDDEEFQEYDPHLLMYKVNIWREGIEMIDELHLKPK
jgi:hypothetical protein